MMNEEKSTVMPDPTQRHESAVNLLKSPRAEIRRLVHYDFLILEALQSPLHRRFVELRKPKHEQMDILFTKEEEAEMLFQFTRPAREVKAILDREGREGFRSCATEAIWFSEENPLPPPYDQIALLEIVRNFVATFH